MSKTYAAVLTFVFASSAYAGREPLPCEQVLRRAVQKTASVLGVREAFGLQLSEPEAAATDVMGRKLVRYSSSAFIIGEGYLPGSGATALVRPTKTSCEILNLSVSVGQ